MPSVQNLGPSMVCDVLPEGHSDSYESRLVLLLKASPDVHANSGAHTLGFHQHRNCFIDAQGDISLAQAGACRSSVLDQGTVGACRQRRSCRPWLS